MPSATPPPSELMQADAALTPLELAARRLRRDALLRVRDDALAAYDELVERNRRARNAEAWHVARIDSVLAIDSVESPEKWEAARARYEESRDTWFSALDRRREAALSAGGVLRSMFVGMIELVDVLQEALDDGTGRPRRWFPAEERRMRRGGVRDLARAGDAVAAYAELIERSRRYRETLLAAYEPGSSEAARREMGDADDRRRETAVRLAGDLSTMLGGMIEVVDILQTVLDEDELHGLFDEEVTAHPDAP